MQVVSTRPRLRKKKSRKTVSHLNAKILLSKLHVQQQRVSTDKKMYALRLLFDRFAVWLSYLLVKCHNYVFTVLRFVTAGEQQLGSDRGLCEPKVQMKRKICSKIEFKVSVFGLFEMALPLHPPHYITATVNKSLPRGGFRKGRATPGGWYAATSPT